MASEDSLRDSVRRMSRHERLSFLVTAVRDFIEDHRDTAVQEVVSALVESHLAAPHSGATPLEDHESPGEAGIGMGRPLETGIVRPDIGEPLITGPIEE